ncbi:hypothetical protein P8452_69198 [Trifolium repens]|nr:hypothetical protein P8452_69198 [Trifolium repens]
MCLLRFVAYRSFSPRLSAAAAVSVDDAYGSFLPRLSAAAAVSLYKFTEKFSQSQKISNSHFLFPQFSHSTNPFLFTSRFVWHCNFSEKSCI